jgi:hypothetical protein
MSEQLSYEDLVAKFAVSPRPSSNLVADSSAAQSRGVLLDTSSAGLFVPPDLIEEDEGAKNPLVWLISAPAAVGKSVLALRLSNSLRQQGRQVLYVPLGGRAIGENFFAGLVSSIFPSATKSEVMNSIVGGGTVIVFDGYDELSMTVEQSRLNKQFVAEIKSELLATGTARQQKTPSILFLFRSAVKSFGIFDELAADSQQFDLQYFSPQKQARFLAMYVEQPSAEAAYAEVLSVLKQQFAVADDEFTQSFFGHAPVLMALGDLIAAEDTANPLRVARNLLEGEFHSNKGVELVKRIIRQLLDREVVKFSRATFEEKGLTSFEPYTPEFQIGLLKRLLTARIDNQEWELVVREYLGKECDRRLSGDPAYAALSPGDKQELEHKYIDEVTTKIQSHPFLDLQNRNLVFTNPIYRERFLAEYLIERTDKELPRVFAAFRDPSYYLAEFILDLLPGRDLVANSGLIFYVVRSLSMATGDQFEAEVSWTDNKWKFEVAAGGLETPEFFYGEELLLIAIPDGEILESLTIEGDDNTLVGLRAWEGEEFKRRLTLSQVSLTAGEIEISATEMSCDAVTLSARPIKFEDDLTGISGIDSLTLLGEVEASEFLRKKYKSAIEPSLGDGDHEQLARKLKAMLCWFRRHGKEDFAIFDKRFNTVVLKKGRDRDALQVADFLKHEGLLLSKPGMVVLAQDQLKKHGIYYVKQNEINFQKGFDELVRRWRAWKERD